MQTVLVMNLFSSLECLEFMPSHVHERKPPQDPRLKDVIIKTLDVSYGGENGFNQAIEMAADALTNVKFSSCSLVFESLYLVMHGSDFNDQESTMVLQPFLVMNLFSSFVPTHSDAHEIHALERPTNDNLTGSFLKRNCYRLFLVKFLKTPANIALVCTTP